MSAKKPVIGILGGMGPQATVDLMNRVIATTPARDDCDHVHLIVDSNPDVPSRIAALIEGSGCSPAPELAAMARRLEAFGADALAIACNTAHAYAKEIETAVSIPLLDVVNLIREKVRTMRLPHRRVGLLASVAVIKLGLFEPALSTSGITLVPPPKADQAALMEVIKAVKRGDLGNSTCSLFANIAGNVFDRPVDVLMVACSELSLLTDSLDENTAYFDTLDLLAEEIVAFGLYGRRKPAAPANPG